MYQDKFGVYTNQEGSRYYVDRSSGNTIYLSYYNPNNGDYAEEGSNIIYDANGNNTGRTTNGGTNTATKGTTWLDVLNSGINAAGSIFGNKDTSGNQTMPVYTPIATPPPPVKKNNTVLYVLITAVLVGGISYAVYKSKKAK